MKKIIFILAAILIFSNSFAQYGGAYDYFQQMPRYQKKLMFYGNDFRAMCNSAYTDEYYFKADNPLYGFKIYIISYEPYPDNNLTQSYKYGEKRERNLYLYRLDGDGWKIASDKPIRVDYMMCDNNGSISYDYYFPLLDKGGYVKNMNNGNIEINLTILVRQQTDEPVFHNEIIILQPIDGEKYRVLK